MKRRDALKSMAALTAAVSTPEALFPQRPSTPAPAETAAEETPALALNLSEEAGVPVPAFFSSEGMAVFRRLADVLLPRTRTPGALDAGAPEFLDFYIGHSAPERQNLYREGLAKLNSEAQRRYQKPFAELPPSDIDSLLAPLREPWTPAVPTDPLAAFLRAAKENFWRATVNSRAWALATEGKRRSGGGTYWYPIE